MKKIKILFLLFAVLLGFLATTKSFAQENNIKLNMLSPLIRVFNVSYERKVADDASLQVGIGLLDNNSIFSDTQIKGVSITPEYRFYLSESHESLDGFYVAPFLRYQNYTATDDDIINGELKLTRYGLGVIAGYQWIFKERVSLDVFGGTSYNNNDISTSGGASENDFDLGFFDAGYGLRGGVTLGIAF